MNHNMNWLRITAYDTTCITSCVKEYALLRMDRLAQDYYRTDSTGGAEQSKLRYTWFCDKVSGQTTLITAI